MFSNVGINLSLSAVDPAAKVLTLAGGSFFVKIGGKLDLLKVSNILKDLEVQETLERIKNGVGKYDKDGTVFNNNEGFLPQKEQGYYSERTVDTPGLEHRGEKRIVLGQGGEMYYTGDHYRTKEGFTKIK